MAYSDRPCPARLQVSRGRTTASPHPTRSPRFTPPLRPRPRMHTPPPHHLLQTRCPPHLGRPLTPATPPQAPRVQRPRLRGRTPPPRSTRSRPRSRPQPRTSRRPRPPLRRGRCRSRRRRRRRRPRSRRSAPSTLTTSSPRWTRCAALCGPWVCSDLPPVASHSRCTPGRPFR